MTNQNSNNPLKNRNMNKKNNNIDPELQPQYPFITNGGMNYRKSGGGENV